jgi:PPM family protein phosphatase
MHQPAGYWQAFIDYAELSDVGLRRANNQDSMAVMLAGNEADFFRRGHLFVVADGMGRHAAGELASKIAVDTVPLEYFKQPHAPPPAALKYALEEGNRRIYARGQQNPDFKGMGTTTSTLAILPQGALVGHVGDSRVYRLRDGVLEQLSFDHSVVWEMQAAARATGTELPTNIPKNYITRSLGHDGRVNVDLEGPFALAEGDTFLLCSDGLSGQVEDDEIGAIIGSLAPTEAVRVLVDLANLRGGPDNITVIVAKVGNLSAVQRAEAPSVGGGGLSRVSLWAWVGLGVGLLLGALLAAADKWIGAAVGLGGALVCGLWVLAQATSGGRRMSWGRAALGKGPHTSQVCRIGDPLLERFAGLIKKLRDSASQQNWSIDWTELDRRGASADRQRQMGNVVEACREYCRSLSFLMSEIRKQRPATRRHLDLEDEVNGG